MGVNWNVVQKRWPWLFILVGVLFGLPSLKLQRRDDDFQLHYDLAPGKPESDGAVLLNLFKFGAARPDLANVQIKTVWQADTGLAMFRPLAAATHWLDYKIGPKTAVSMHWHNLLWYGALCCLVGFLFLHFVGGWYAALGAMLYAFHYLNGWMVCWISGRNGLIAATLSVATILAYHRAYRLEYSARMRNLAVLFFILSLCSSEAGVIAGAYVFAYEAAMSSDSLRARLKRLVPFVAIAAAWLVVRKLAGFGLIGAPFDYVDPISQPGKFLQILPNSIFRQTVHHFSLSPNPTDVRWQVLVLLAWLAIALLPTIKDRCTKFFALASLLSCLPFAAGWGDIRYHFFVSISFVGWTIAVLRYWIVALHGVPWRKRVAGVVIAGAAVLPVLLGLELIAPVQRSTFAGGSWGQIRLAAQLVQSKPPQNFYVGVLNAYGHPTDFALVAAVGFGSSMSRAGVCLADTKGKIQITRAGPSTLLLGSEFGIFPTDRSVGDIVDFDIGKLTIVNMVGNIATHARFDFNQNIDEAPWIWKTWSAELSDWTTVTLPLVGNTLTL